jgi:Spy/CpxP family protein refolding chaperone
MTPFIFREHGNHDGPIVSAMGFSVDRRWWNDSSVAQELNLTPEQVKRMDTVFEQSKLRLIDARANVEKQELVLEPLLSANPVNTAKASLQIDKVANARAELEKANAKMLLGIRGVLTPEQWTKLNDRHRGRGRDGFQLHGPPVTPNPSPAPSPAPNPPGR